MLYSKYRGTRKLFFTYILSLLLVFPISGLSAEEPDFELIRSEVTKKCSLLKADLKKEKLSVKSNETDLSTKIAKKELSKDALNDLIKAHLASIDVYNKKIETFNHNCANINENKTVSSKSKKKEVTPKPKEKVQAKHAAPKAPPKVAQIATPTAPKTKKKTVIAKAPKPIKKLSPPAPKSTKKTVAIAPKLESNKTSDLVKTHSPTIKPNEVLASDKKIRSLHGYFLQIGAFKSPRLT
ncbi:MAG: hypothetical protein R8K22_02360, partial [Mariprofundaceae bacterium]